MPSQVSDSRCEQNDANMLKRDSGAGAPIRWRDDGLTHTIPPVMSPNVLIDQGNYPSFWR